MTQEEKELLLTDLCARLPYGVKCREFKLDSQICTLTADLLDKVDNLEPYLRPMSSMTEDEKEKLKSKCLHTETEEDWEGVRSDSWGIEILDKYDTERWDNTIYVSSIINMDAIDWLNEHHFDYRGLIGNGLALEAPKEMYNT